MENEKMMVEYKAGSEPVRLTLAMVKRYLVSGKAELVTDQEAVFFLKTCAAMKLNPFIRDCYLVKYDTSPAAIIVSRHWFARNARNRPDCKGWRNGVIVRTDRGLEYRDGTLVLDDEELVGGWAEGKPVGWDEPYRLTVNLKPYIKTNREGKPTQFWVAEKQPEMIAKIAEVQLLRKLWGAEARNIYTAEEMPDVELNPNVVDLDKAEYEVKEPDVSAAGGPTLKAKPYQAPDEGGQHDGDDQDNPPPPPDQKSEGDPLADTGNPWDAKTDKGQFAWLNMRSGFPEFCGKHRDHWLDASPEARREAVDKWRRTQKDLQLPAWMVASHDLPPDPDGAGEPEADPETDRGKTTTTGADQWAGVSGPMKAIFAKKIRSFFDPVDQDHYEAWFKSAIIALVDKDGITMQEALTMAINNPNGFFAEVETKVGKIPVFQKKDPGKTDILEEKSRKEREALKETIKTDFSKETIFQAKKDLGFPVGDEAWPPSLKGMAMLYDECNKIG